MFANVSNKDTFLNLSQLESFILENQLGPVQIQIGYPKQSIVNKSGLIIGSAAKSQKFGLDDLLNQKLNDLDIDKKIRLALNLPQPEEKKAPTFESIIITPFEKYEVTFNTLMDEIRFGNIYEVNYCIQAQINNLELDGMRLFANLLTVTRAPYCNYTETKDELFMGFSPELFLQKKGNTLIAKPMKGTRKRIHDDQDKDNALIQELASSVKERAENVMIVDLMRNDMSKIAKPNSVKVTGLFEVETFATVHQMTSTITCELKNNIRFSEIIEAMFPTGSMTGAPKHSAMNLIEQTEHAPREWFAGCSGIIYENGDFDLSVNIRCLIYNKLSKKGVVWAGSAITAYANAKDEYNECLLKMKPILNALEINR
ncbi:MAG: anthranilate synthase component I family protein [Bacteroidetes bacterium]|nr:anthranilate synthase component I family protein [Bacteroidota bacterium]